jgi:SnoaL-like domain
MKRQILNHRVVRHAAILMFVLLCQAWGVSATPGESVNQATQEWIAKQEIAVLQRRYAQATDMIAADRTANEAEVEVIYKSIFTEDAEMGVLDRLTLDGPMKWLELVKAKFVPLDNAQHLIGSQVVEIESLPDDEGLGGSATMRSYVQATHVNSDGTLERVLGTYHSAAIYVPESGWRLSKMVLELLSTEDAKIAAPLELEAPG